MNNSKKITPKELLQWLLNQENEALENAKRHEGDGFAASIEYARAATFGKVVKKITGELKSKTANREILLSC